MSLKGDKYETVEEIKTRLENTVVMYDGKPVYISAVQMPVAEDGKEIARVLFYDLPLKGAGQKTTRKYLSSRNFDLTPFKMGYVNIGGEALFVTRSPMRQYKQGLSTGTVSITNIKGQRSDKVGFNELLRSQAFVDMIEGKYPTFEEAGQLLGEKGTTSIAISRSFAFQLDHELEALYLSHKGIKCGIAMKDDRGIKVAPKFAFLREEMQEHRIPVL